MGTMEWCFFKGNCMNENRFKELREKIDCWAFGQEMDNTVGYLAQLTEEEKTRIIEEADLAMKYTVMLHDPETGERVCVPHRRNEQMWIQHWEEHPQWTYELNRHDFLYTLLYASVLTGDQTYAGMLRWYIFDWMIKNPMVLSGTETTRPADTGLRCLNWCGVIRQMIADGAIDEEDTVVYFQNMEMQFEYLRRRYVGSNTISSLGIPQTVAVCAAYIWFSDFLSQENGMEQWAWGELHRQLELQVLEDGSHREDRGIIDGDSDLAYELVLGVCEQLLSYCQDAEKVGIRLCGETAAAVDLQTGWLRKTVECMRKRSLYLPYGKAGNVDDPEMSLYSYSPDSESLNIRSDWSAKADYTQMRQLSVDGMIKPYVRELADIYYAEMSSDKGEAYMQMDRMLVLPGGVWIISPGAQVKRTEINCQADTEKQVWKLVGEATAVKIHSCRTLEQKIVEDTGIVILAPEGTEIKRAAVFQFGRPAPLAKSLVTALDVKLPSGEVWTVVMWNEKIDMRNKMFLCHGIPFSGNVVVFRGKEKEAQRFLLKN